MAGEHFADDESFAIGNCGELFAIGENFELIENVNSGNSREHFMATWVADTDTLNESSLLEIARSSSWSVSIPSRQKYIIP